MSGNLVFLHGRGEPRDSPLAKTIDLVFDGRLEQPDLSTTYTFPFDEQVRAIAPSLSSASVVFAFSHGALVALAWALSIYEHQSIPSMLLIGVPYGRPATASTTGYFAPKRVKKALEALGQRGETVASRHLKNRLAVVGGELDEQCPPEELLRPMAAWGFRVHVVPGAGHDPTSAPAAVEALHAIVSDFATRVRQTESE